MAVTTSTNLSKSDKAVKALLKATFPDYTGRTIKLAVQESYFMEDYWDGGSRTYVRAFDMASGKVADPNHAVNNPMNRVAHATFAIPDGIAMVEHVIFCGKDCGIRVVVNPATAPNALPAAR